MDSLQAIAQDLFYKVRSRFGGLKLGNQDGEVTITPEDARFFDFEYVENDKSLGHVTISINENNSLKVYFSTNITEEMDDNEKQTWYKFLKELRRFSKKRLMNFDTRDISKDILHTRDYAFLSNNANTFNKTNDEKFVGDNMMNESQMYGTSKTSYQDLQDTRLIIKHKKSLNDYDPAARTRNISAMFVENSKGERFKYPYNHLAGARAMQRHVANGGLPYDQIGESIVGMSEKISHLKNFTNYINRNGLISEDTTDLVEKTKQELVNLREAIKKLSRQTYYENYVNNFETEEAVNLPEEIEQELVEKFTIKNFNEEIKTVFPILYKFMKENELGYNDVVDFVQTEDTSNNETTKEVNHLEDLENWILKIEEATNVTSEDPDIRDHAIDSLKKLVKEHFPAGNNGMNAINALEDIIEDPELQNQIKELAEEDPDNCVRGLVKNWLENNAPEVLDELDFGDFVEESAEQLNEFLPALLGVGRAVLGPLTNLVRGGAAKGLEKIAQLGKKAKVPQDSKKAADKVAQAGAGKSIDDLAKQAEKAKPKTDTPKADIEIVVPKAKPNAPKATSAPAQANKTGPAAAGVDAAKDVLKGPANIGSKIAGPAAVGTGLAIGGNEVGKAIGGAVDDITSFGSETFDTAEEYLDKITDTLGQGVEAIADMDILGQIAEIAKQYALPVGLVIAALWGGSKILGWLFDDTQDEDALLKMLEEDINEEIKSKNSNNDLPFEPDDEPTDTDEFGNKIKKKNVAKHLAKKGMRQAMDKETIQEVAEFVMSHYDAENKVFPKGPTAIALSVEKKFGEMAGMAAQKMVERMAPQQDGDVFETDLDEAGRDNDMDAALHKAFGMEGDFVPFDERPRDGEEIELRVPVRYTKAEQVIRDTFSNETGIDKDKVSVEYTRGERSVKIDGQTPHPEILSALNGTLDSLDTGGISGMYDDVNDIARLAGL